MRRTTLIPFVLFVLAANTAFAASVQVKLTPVLPSETRTLLTNDFRRLENTDIQEKNTAANIIFGVDDLNRDTLVDWLNARLKFLVPNEYIDIAKIQDGELPDFMTVLANGYVFENPGVIPEALRRNTQAYGLADNIGTGIYLLGKSSKQLFGIRFSDSEEVLPVTSPRIGIVGIYPDLFGRQEPFPAEVRLAVLFHEARHTDGNGKSLGFLHRNCPPGHDYAGTPSCDIAENGPYAIEGNFLKLAARDCRDCSVRDEEILNIFAADSLGRILDFDFVKLSGVDPTKCWANEGMYPKECLYTRIESDTWDATPEGVK